MANPSSRGARADAVLRHDCPVAPPLASVLVDANGPRHRRGVRHDLCTIPPPAVMGCRLGERPSGPVVEGANSPKEPWPAWRASESSTPTGRSFTMQS
mgnify:CR=1 FL=1